MIKKMTGMDALGLLIKAKTGLAPGTADLIEFDPTMSILLGATDDDGKNVECVIGIKEFVERPNDSFPVHLAIAPLVNLYHEAYGHGGQVRREFDKNTPLSQVLAASHYGCKAAESYYGFKNGKPTRQYYLQPKEIAAQYAGIKAANQFLSAEYDSETAGYMLKQYVRYRVMRGSKCIDRIPLDLSVPAILQQLDRTFVRRVSAHRNYNQTSNGIDYLTEYASRTHQPKLLAAVAGCRDGLRQDMMMASVWMALFDYRDKVKTRPAMTVLPWSVASAFDTSVPLLEPRPGIDGLSLQQLEVPKPSAETNDAGRGGTTPKGRDPGSLGALTEKFEADAEKRKDGDDPEYDG